MSHDCKCAHVIQKKSPEGDYQPVKVGRPKCPICRGTGRVKTCTICDGCGMVRSAICEPCAGLGKVACAA